jgi:hypothetical protein
VSVRERTVSRLQASRTPTDRDVLDLSPPGQSRHTFISRAANCFGSDGAAVQCTRHGADRAPRAGRHSGGLAIKATHMQQ